MSIRVIKVPDIGEGIAEVELTAWHVQAGDDVAEDQPLADVMTDKANVEIPSPVAGKVLALGGEVGNVLAVGSELIRIEVGASGEKAVAAEAPRVGDAGSTAAARGRAGSEGGYGLAATGAPAARRSAAGEPTATDRSRLRRCDDAPGSSASN